MSRKRKQIEESRDVLMDSEDTAQAREPPEEPCTTEHTECEGCPYAAHGFACWPGDCLRTRMEQIQKIGGE